MPMQKVNTGYLSKMVGEYRSKLTEDTAVADIITFAEAGWGLGFELFPVQRFILKCFYGLPLDDQEKTIDLPNETNDRIIGHFTEKEFFDYLVANRRVNQSAYTPGETHNELMLCCGRRASKSNIISIVCAYELHRMIKLENPQAYYGFPSGSEIDITTVAASDGQAATLFNMIKNRILDCPFFNGRLDADTQTYLSLRTDDDMKMQRAGSVRVYCAGAGSAALRGKNNLIVVVDEAAFFDNLGKASLPEAWNALTPSTTTFIPKGKTRCEGKRILLSSPLAKSGMFWDKFCEAFEMPDGMLMFQMYTTMVNPRVSATDLRMAQRRDKAKFLCEFCGEFSDTVAAWADPDALAACVDSRRRLNQPKGDPGLDYFMGVDFGGKNDGSAVAICHREDNIIVLDYADVYFAAGSDAWDGIAPYYGEANRLFAEEEIVPLTGFADEIQRLCDRFNIVEGWFDQFNGYGLLELLKERGLTKFETRNVTAALNCQVFQATKSLLGSGNLRLFDHPVLIPELAGLEERREGSRLTVEAPQRTGYHDDLADAFVRAVWAAYSSKKGAIKRVTLGLGGAGGAGSYNAFRLDRYRRHGGDQRLVGRPI